MTVIKLSRRCDKKPPARPGWNEGEECHPFAYWLAVHQDKRLVERQLLEEVCNNGYGWANIGEDDFNIGENSFEHHQSGGSNWRWSRVVRIVLDPLHVASEIYGGHVTWNPDRSNSDTWNWDEFSGKGERGVRMCSPKGEDGDDTMGGGYVIIPHVSLPPTFVRAGWKRTALEKCSVYVDGVDRGYTVHGKPTDDADASFRALATSVTERGSEQQVLFVEVTDDKWVGPGMQTAGKTWLYDDHLEMWTSNQVTWDGPCTSREDGDPKQWAIRVADGKVFPAMGRPTVRPKVERVWPMGTPGLGGSARFKISMPWPQGTQSNVTVVYSDSDDGLEQKRLIATSSIWFGWAATLGIIRDVKSEAATCEVRDGGLRPLLKKPQLIPDQAMVPVPGESE